MRNAQTYANTSLKMFIRLQFSYGLQTKMSLVRMLAVIPRDFWIQLV